MYNGEEYIEMGDPLEKIWIRGVPFHNTTVNEGAKFLLSTMEAREKPAIVVTPNSEIVQMCIEDDGFSRLIGQADFIVPDGVGVVYASKILGTPLKEKVAGFDLISAMLPLLEQEKKRIFLLGAGPGVAQLAAENLLKKFPNLLIVGTQDGYFKQEEPVVEMINEAKADLLLVCLGAPKQEEFMFRWKESLQVSVMMGLGGSLDVFAGKVKRAPAIFIRLGLEWFYRLIKEPKRFVRMLKLPQFLFGTIWYKIRGGK